ncbi:sugar ABC transporter permease [Sphaerochaeta halotolerans]|jgi:arabinosaccharide transport system permease protein|uniref:Sugar ABC transporter permease n=1 Tax=Sphaerochaeta halotolerans TaxID=2293840 RepID=A0A372MGI2_9SPIR|nr:sugar ABC transporter permease [Sphaerochaeta halotolerans]RFU94553.1 sugar ABC transporter permease [Sphaerochaeta halotolerans]
MTRKQTLGSAKIAPYVFILPFIASFLIFYLYPIISTVIMGFQQVYPGQVEFIGLENYRKLDNPEFKVALKNSFRYTVYTIALLIPIPLLLSVWLNSGNRAINTVYRSVLYIPSLVSIVVAGTIMRLLFASSDKSFINTLAIAVGVEPRQWLLGGSHQAMILLLILALWRWVGVNIIYFLSGLQAIPDELYEAADIDGASPSQKLWRITIPLLKNTTIFVTTISIFGGFAMFEESFILWAGKPSPNNVGLTIVGHLYNKGFQEGEMGMASAIGIVLLIIVFSLSISFLKLFGFFEAEGRR